MGIGSPRGRARAASHRRALRLVVWSWLVLGSVLVATRARGQEIPGPLSRPCKHPCVNQIIFEDPPKLDSWILHARIVPMSDIDPANEDVTVEISNVNDVIFASTLPAGTLTAASGGKQFYFRDPTARLLGGVGRISIRPRNDAIGGFRVDAVVYEDFSLATLPDMTTRILVGNDSFTNTSTWDMRSYGWSVDFPP